DFWQLFSQIFGETLLAFARFATTSYLKCVKSVRSLVLVIEHIYDILLTNEMVNITTVLPEGLNFHNGVQKVVAIFQRQTIQKNMVYSHIFAVMPYMFTYPF